MFPPGTTLEEIFAWERAQRARGLNPYSDEVMFPRSYSDPDPEQIKRTARAWKPRKKRKSNMAKRRKKKAHCKRVPVRKGSSKKRLMCFSASGKIVSAKRSKAGKKAARKRRR